MAIEIKPTRSELIKFKKSIILAKSGYNLLKKKRDGLILEFFEVLGKVKNLRSDVVDEYRKALYKMNIARLLESDLKIKSIAMAIANKPDIEFGTKNIMGVLVPTIKSGELKRKMMERGYGIYNSASIDEAADAYEKVTERVIRAAEVETTMRRLLKEIEKTKRRVNALEFEVIPRMEKTKNFIALRLEEMERENTFRLKRIKAKLSG
ncbi:MAG: V-type ATP synthase subunit D [Candidatus Woesearchaeota archaeon]|nr:V-type ATP synthase subunit D [Candidatus Woesearchaeota archaeon]